MAKPPIIPGQYYHIYNRGVAKQDIFFKDSHWSFFLRRMKKYFKSELTDIFAYCLMPNHYHLLVHVKSKDFGHRVMQPMMISYTRAINQDMKRVGPIFQGRYQAKLVESTEQLTQLTRYIHRNPIEAGRVKLPEDWKFSSYREYLGIRKGNIPKVDFKLLGFQNKEQYRQYVLTPMNTDKIQNAMFDEF